MRYVWTCKVIVDDGKDLPRAFDGPPRKAVIGAISAAGLNITACFSGWGGNVTKIEQEIIDERGPGTDGIHVAGQDPKARGH